MERSEFNFIDMRSPVLITKIKQPFPAYVDHDHKPVTVMNPYSGESCQLDPEAHAIYEVIMGAERIVNAQSDEEYGENRNPLWEYIAKGKEWFAEHYPEEFMILLD